MTPTTLPSSSSSSPEPTPSRVDPRSPFVFDLRELGRSPGTMRQYSRVAPAPAGFGTEVIGVREGVIVTMSLQLESVSEGVLVSGVVNADVEGECGRCLEPILDAVYVDIRELYAYAASTTAETSGDDETYRVSGDRIDIEPVVRDAIVLAMPWAPLCRFDCAGLCPECGLRRDDLPPDHSHEVLDVRWAALSGHLPVPEDFSDEQQVW